MVKVYGKPECVQCEYTQKKLGEAKVPFEYHDITTEPEARKIVEECGKTQLPLVVANDQSWNGFRPDHIKSLASA